jgi:hypothetical protein
MISRRTARILGEVYQRFFAGKKKNPNYHPGGMGKPEYYTVFHERLYDFLFERNYDAWFCNAARQLYLVYRLDERELKDFVMQLHTGEAIAAATPDWDWEQRRQLGQRYLRDLTQDILAYWHNDLDDYSKRDRQGTIDQLLRSLELDGYLYRDGKLLFPESDILDVKEESGVLNSLYTTLLLANEEITFHHLELSEQHYLAHKWDDSIANCRKFLESVLREVASAHSTSCKKTSLPEVTYERPVLIRNYLEEEGLLERKEKDTLAQVYQLLSTTGSHPYIAQSDQSRLLRHLALTFAQFVMLRFQGYLTSATNPPPTS